MVDHVLVAYDGSPQAEDALEYALAEHADAEISVLNVIDPVAAGYSPNMRLPRAAEEWFESAKADAENVLTEAEAIAEQRGVDVETAVGVGRPANAVVEYAAENEVDHVVVGSHGRTGVSRVLLGSVAEAVMRESPVPVTVVRWNEGGDAASDGDPDGDRTATDEPAGRNGDPAGEGSSGDLDPGDAGPSDGSSGDGNPGDDDPGGASGSDGGER